IGDDYGCPKEEGAGREVGKAAAACSSSREAAPPEMGVVPVGELKQSASAKIRTFRPSLSSRHHADWLLSDVSSDLTVEVGTTSFSLHKFPLVSRSGKIRKLLSESKDPKLSRINLQMVPGGAEAFELAAKFCYGVAVDLTLSNVAMLRCAAHHLQMTDDYSDKNLESRAEAFLRDTVFPSIPNSITVLHHCEPLLPVAEDVNLVGRLVSEIAANASKEQLTSGLSKLELKPRMGAESADPGAADWWGKNLAVLGLDFFQKAVSAMRSKGLRQDTVGRILINYAHSALEGLAAARDAAAQPGKGGCFLEAEAQKKQRLVVETMVHPNIKESERYRLCKTIDCQKLSQEACSHAAQNERLPVQMAVQVLYFEQLRLRNAMNRGGHDQFFLSSASVASSQFPGHRPGSGVGSGAASPRDNYALVRRENRELKLEVARMRMRLTDLEKDHVSMKQELVRASPGPTGLLRSFTRKLGKLNDLFKLWDQKKSSASAVNPPKNSAEARLLFQRRRRHSIS
ncbi:hypothetical protein Taro_012436, partial [Colocasia esculenta]|nr:hypothetical protein [Colocasia esculenta]